jgi:hypothetical protein
MGGTSYDYVSAASAIAAASTKVGGVMHFSSASVSHARATGTALVVHPLLDPKHKNSRGEFIRESLDSDAHPESRAIAVIFDKTGSMGSVPGILLKELPKLHAGLVKNDFVAHPHILSGAFDDVKVQHDVPIEISQFEAGNETDDAGPKIILTGNGGGNDIESADILLYFLAHFSKLDCLEKRGDKGFLFVISDEMFDRKTRRSELTAVFGDDFPLPPEDTPIEATVEKLKKSYEVFYIHPRGGSYQGDKSLTAQMKKLFGERYVVGTDERNICETIIGLIAATEGYDADDITAGLVNVGTSAATAAAVTSALAPYTGGALTKAKAKADGELVAAGADDSGRL